MNKSLLFSGSLLPHQTKYPIRKTHAHTLTQTHTLLNVKGHKRTKALKAEYEHNA